MKAIGWMTKPKAKEHTSILMELSMKVIGTEINNTEKEKRDGLMVQNTKETMLMERRKALATSLGWMVLITPANSQKIILKETAFINGMMKGSMMGAGKTIKCMGEENSLGLTGENLQDIT